MQLNNMKCILVTGCVGFIGAKVSEFLLNDGYTVVGMDNMNDAYEMRLRHWRLDQIINHSNFEYTGRRKNE
ncbi:MAG: GDP-mannose 4,6-dehydratase [Candidatus Marinimicrobia bacterium]|nr:GDP-mannose 4,6-dehydratase [Candidatus Neomarinimicrobiota bacterium]